MHLHDTVSFAQRFVFCSATSDEFLCHVVLVVTEVSAGLWTIMYAIHFAMYHSLCHIHLHARYSHHRLPCSHHSGSMPLPHTPPAWQHPTMHSILPASFSAYCTSNVTLPAATVGDDDCVKIFLQRDTPDYRQQGIPTQGIDDTRNVTQTCQQYTDPKLYA